MPIRLLVSGERNVKVFARESQIRILTDSERGVDILSNQ